VGAAVQTGSTRHRGHLLSYCACPWWLWRWRIIRWNENWQGKPKYSEKTCPSATLSTTNPTWPDPGLNPGRRGGKPATNRLSYGAALTAQVKYTLHRFLYKSLWTLAPIVLLIKSRPDLVENTFHFCIPIISVGTCLSAKALPNNGLRILACYEFVA
jgi:hypothetical protein